MSIRTMKENNGFPLKLHTGCYAFRLLVETHQTPKNVKTCNQLSHVTVTKSDQSAGAWSVRWAVAVKLL